MSARDAAQLRAGILAQRRWMAERGGSLRGYVATYGTKGDPGCYGDGGRAIWEADSAALARLEREYEYAANRRAPRMRS